MDGNQYRQGHYTVYSDEPLIIVCISIIFSMIIEIYIAFPEHG